MRKCNLCPLGATSHGPVPPQGDPNSRIWIIGEAPGETEDRVGVPFIGKAGQEMDNYLILAGLRREECYVTNLVKCRPPANRDPKPEEIAACAPILAEELTHADEDTIFVPLGRFATQYLLGPVKLDMVHGIPQRREDGGITVPCYHPAAGMHQTSIMTHLLNDFEAMGKVSKGIIRPEDWLDKYPKPEYEELLTEADVLSVFKGAAVIGCDTEEDGWSVQLSLSPGTGYILRSKATFSAAKVLMENPEVTVVMHNAQHDLRVLAKLGIRPKNWYCTMLMANLLQDVPRGLKALAYRLAGMRMRSYMDVVAPYTKRLAFEYLAAVSCRDWPKPQPETKLVGGKVKVTQPQSLNTRIKRMFTDLSKNPDLDLFERWEKQPERLMVEAEFGSLKQATLREVEFQEALQYACSDPDATLRVFPILLARIEKEGLMGSLLRDQRAVYAVMEMEETGMRLDPGHLLEQGARYERTMEEVKAEITVIAGYPINPGSPDDVAKLLFNDLKLPPGKKTKGGDRFTTDDDLLQTLKDKHPVVPLIIKYREMQIMWKNFVKGVMANYLKSGDGRVHPDLSMISTETGRLASYDPNLLAFPVPSRSDEGKPLRDSFVAGPGRSFVEGDYSQVEIRVMADQGQEETMLRVLRDGGDIHRQTAADIFGIPADQVESWQRYAVKMVNFGIPYGMTEKKMHDDMAQYGWSKNRCKEFIAKWLATFSGIGRLMTRYHNEAKRFKAVRDFLGRMRRIPEVKSVHFWIRESGLRKAGNHPIQSGAQGIMKEAMGLIFDLLEMLRTDGHYIRVLLQIHDSLLFEMDDDIIPWVLPMIRVIMEGAIKLSIPTPVDFKIGKRWGSM